MGLQHIKAIKKSKFSSLHSIVEIKKKGMELSKKFKVPLYKNIKILLEKDKPDAVIIATPNILHETDTIWLVDREMAIYTIVIAGVWQSAGFV